MSYTKGKWKIDGGTNSEGDLFVWQADNYMGGQRLRHGLAQIFYDGARLHGGNVKDNARLIAAAPELLEACINAAKFLPSGSTPYDILYDAINRATGAESEASNG